MPWLRVVDGFQSLQHVLLNDIVLQSKRYVTRPLFKVSSPVPPISSCDRTNLMRTRSRSSVLSSSGRPAGGAEARTWPSEIGLRFVRLQIADIQLAHRSIEFGLLRGVQLVEVFLRFCRWFFSRFSTRTRLAMPISTTAAPPTTQTRSRGEATRGAQSCRLVAPRRRRAPWRPG